MPDAYAYRASDEFAEALRRRIDERDEFINATVIPWDEAHPEAVSMWANNSLDLPTDRRCTGFRDAGGEVPAGLSRNKERVVLLPARGKAGDPWREARKLMGRMPLVGEVFRRFAVPDHLLDFNAGVSYRAVIAMPPRPHAVWIKYGRAVDVNPHLIPGNVSEFYAALKAAEAATRKESTDVQR